jgi:hypothetical protein
LSTQIKILHPLAATPSARAVVGLMPDGFRLIGLSTQRLRLTDSGFLGRPIDLAILELLVGLASGEEGADSKLIDSLSREFDTDRGRLGVISKSFRSLPPKNDFAPDTWRPTGSNVQDDHADSPIDETFSAERLFAVHAPLLFNATKSGYEHINHMGYVDLRLTARQLAALQYLVMPATNAELLQLITAGDKYFSGDQALSLLESLLDANLLRSFAPDDPHIEMIFNDGSRWKRDQERGARRLLKAIDRAVKKNPIRPGMIPVFPVNVDWSIPPVALGFLFTMARKHKNGSLNDAFDFRPTWLVDGAAPVPEGPMISLYSHYIWNSVQMLANAARTKAANPLALNIHGGPDVPKYEYDVGNYFADHPYVDVAVHGEGEVTICEILEKLAPAMLKGDIVDLSVLDNVAGLSYRGADGRPVRTGERPRMEKLDDIPSPYLTGEFDLFAEAGAPNVILETNRGCPYGCTFCDWGSATASKIRKFDLDRVFAEFEWCARNKVGSVGLADANFGQFERDISIAQKCADLKGIYGFPRSMGTNYAKNSVKHLKPIIDALVKADILASGLLSLQSMDEGTLSVINRANIKLKKYEALAAEFRANDLPLYVDLMMGLPGSTVDSFRNDLQECVDREVYAKVHPTQLLVNSPMNQPAYREKHGITVKPTEMVRSCVTFTEDDYVEMTKIRKIFLVVEKFGILRHVLRYARQETGLREMDILSRLMAAADLEGERWPALRFTFLFIPSVMVPPVDWGWFLADVHRFFVEQLGIADDAALDSALRAQHAMMPAPERRFPDTTELTCDYASWHADVLYAKENGHLQDWPEQVPSLRSYGPGTITVTDPNLVCQLSLGRNFNSGVWDIWELSSEIARPSDGAPSG